MPKGSTGGGLVPIPNCYINLPGIRQIVMNNLPEISDSKSASYQDTTIIGRSFPVKTFSHSENRAIGWTLHLFVLKDGDALNNLNILRTLESCVYPRNVGPGPYAPPIICQIKCGNLLSTGNQPLNVVLKSYSVKFPTDVAWDAQQFTPYKLDIDLSFEVVYASNMLPGASNIIQMGM